MISTRTIDSDERNSPTGFALPALAGGIWITRQAEKLEDRKCPGSRSVPPGSCGLFFSETLLFRSSLLMGIPSWVPINDFTNR